MLEIELISIFRWSN